MLESAVWGVDHYPEVDSHCVLLKCPGRRQRHTQVTDAKGAVGVRAARAQSGKGNASRNAKSGKQGVGKQCAEPGPFVRSTLRTLGFRV